MKKILLVTLLSSTLAIGSCDSLKQIAGILVPSEFEMAAGLREALTQGMFRSFDAFANPEGNAAIRFAFPGDAAKIEKTLKDLGMQKLVDQVTSKFTRAASSAVTAAKPIFLDAVRNMTIRDAVGILLTDNQRAATDYFKSNMSASLMTAFRPIVDSSINLTGANRDWSSIVNVYNKIPFINQPLESSLTDFIAARAVDYMFSTIAKEEEDIRTKLEFRKTDLMKKVFGYAEQELARRRN
jgi:hypothetical protein